ncbi:hypothetical protein [Aquibium sp. ELW1220]|uniref:hypothetical protein n=1 Tax=Aquibium sp. ELW1220 TaxID=2976766 RepID=UPI0025B1A0FE|nr:hypothetical protein [Aquibium sp. ELW1220]MDN2583150.1 hypothetical protein [Aquibium sp. ELW1220]
MRRQLREIGPLAVVISGFLLWSAAFLAIYGAQATGCSLGWNAEILVGPLTVQRAVLIALFAVVLAGHVGLLVRSTAWTTVDGRPETGTADFMRKAASRLALLSAAASAVCFAGVIWLTPC